MAERYAIMRSKSNHPYWNVWASTRTVEVVACGALLLSSGMVIGEHVYDQPHSHVDSGAPEPTTINTMFASGGTNTSAGVIRNFYIPFEQG
jgi:hypothetical protein